MRLVEGVRVVEAFADGARGIEMPLLAEHLDSLGIDRGGGAVRRTRPCRA